MMTIANPIYDTVFKYLMEDERIARTILSALLKEDIVKVEVRPHEYTNGQKEVLSIFRIDFGATIRKSDGKEQLILIELQKTWLPTETLRFRQYLGVHYQNPKNIIYDSADRHALPMEAVYLLRHTVGDIEEPVIYVRHQAFNYDDEPVKHGIPNHFVDSLNHDSIIVQIPRLHGRINNRLDKVLSIFDQKRVSHESEHYLSLDDHAFDTADDDMQPIIHRLMMAAVSVEMRQNMNVEDEYFSLIKEQEGKVYGLERDLAEKMALLNEKDDELAEKEGELAEKASQLAEKDGQLAEKDGQLAEKDGQLAEKDGQLAEKDGQLAEKDGQLAEKDGQLAEKDGQLAEKDGQLKSLVKMLMQTGRSVDDIATALHIDKEKVQNMMNEKES